MRAPLKATAHGLADYGFLGLLLGGPTLLRLSGRTRLLAAGFGAMQGTINALTDTPVGVKRLLTLRTHGYLELASAPAFVTLPVVTGAADDTRDKAAWLAAFALLATVYTLTDWEAPADS